MIPRRFFWLFDLLIFSFSFLATYFLFPYLQKLFLPGGSLLSSWLEVLVSPPTGSGPLPPLAELLWIFAMMVPTALLVLGMLGNHIVMFNQSRMRIWVGSLVAPLTGLSLIALVLFTLKDPAWSRLFVFSFAATSSLGLSSYRGVLRTYYMRRRAAGYYAKNVMLIGQLSDVEWMSRYFSENIPSSDYRLVGYLQVGANGNTATKSGESCISLLGGVHDLGEMIIHRPIHEVIAVYSEPDGEWIKKVIENCDYFRVMLRIIPSALIVQEFRDLQVLYHKEPLRLPAIILTPPHWESEILFFKRLLDIAISAILLVLLAPMFLLIAIAIKLTTPGLPILYPWRVVGQNGVEFTGYKFTTMFANADQRKAQLVQHNEMSGPVFKMKDDPRITPLGHFLRKYSLNELPQLWSVLKGDMSLVGPRPAFRHELERYEFWHKRKLSIKPGITCLWQVNGRNEISSFDEWVKMDLEYINSWSLMLDFKILLRTAWSVVRGTGW